MWMFFTEDLPADFQILLESWIRLGVTTLVFERLSMDRSTKSYSIVSKFGHRLSGQLLQASNVRLGGDGLVMIDTLHPLPQSQQFLSGLDRFGIVVRRFEFDDPFLQLHRLLGIIPREHPLPLRLLRQLRLFGILGDHERRQRAAEQDQSDASDHGRVPGSGRSDRDSTVTAKPKSNTKMASTVFPPADSPPVIRAINGASCHAWVRAVRV
jgi:hypothetical protein